MKALVLMLSVTGALAWGAVASAQFGYGVPGGHFGSGGLYGGGGSPLGIQNSSLPYGSMSPGSGSNTLFQGFTYSPYNYSSPSYGLLSPSFGGASSSLRFGTSSPLGFTVPTYAVPTDTVPPYSAPTYRERLQFTAEAGHSYGGLTRSARKVFRPDGFLSQAHGTNFYSTGFGFSPTWRNRFHVRPW